MRRFFRGLKQISRAGEILRCFKECDDSIRVTLGYLGLLELEYPRLICLTNGPTIRIWSWHDLTTVWAVWFGEEYRLASTDESILDLGANIGAFSLLSASKSNRRIIAVEPFPANCNRLHQNVDQVPQITAVEAAVDFRERLLYMPCDSKIPSHSRTVQNHLPEGAEEKSNNYVAVPTVTLASLISRLGGRVDFLKIDIEGYEYALLEGTDPEVLRRIKRIGLEYHGDDGYARVVKILREVGFRPTRHIAQAGRGIAEFVLTE